MSKTEFKKKSNCLNCGSLTGKETAFCQRCGQSTKTRTFSIREFFRKDLIQVVFSDEKGFFYFLKQLVTRPGQMVFEYIEGKRAYHIPFGSFYMVILGFLVLISYFSELQIGNFLVIEDEEDTAIQNAFDFIDDSPKITNLVQIPVMAIFSFGKHL